MADTPKTIAVLYPNDTHNKAALGTLIVHPLNPAFKAVQVGVQFLSVDPQGRVYLDPACSAWQAFQLGENGQFLIAGRDNGNTFVLGFVAYSGPAVP